MRAFDFGKSVAGKVTCTESLEEASAFNVPGKYPYEQLRFFARLAPVTRQDLCARCEACIVLCPAAALVLRELLETDSGSCIACRACVKTCPVEARVVEDPDELHSRVVEH
jgi:ferredoxin